MQAKLSRWNFLYSVARLFITNSFLYYTAIVCKVTASVSIVHMALYEDELMSLIGPQTMQDNIYGACTKVTVIGRAGEGGNLVIEEVERNFTSI